MNDKIIKLNIMLLVLVLLVVSMIGIEVDKISAELKIFQETIPTDPVRKKKN